MTSWAWMLRVIRFIGLDVECGMFCRMCCRFWKWALGGDSCLYLLMNASLMLEGRSSLCGVESCVRQVLPDMLMVGN